MEQLLRPRLDPVELHIGKAGQVVGEDMFEIARHQRGTIADRDPALHAIADIARRGLQVFDVGDNAAGLFDNDPAILGRLGTARGAIEQLDSELLLKLVHSAAERDLLHIERSRRPREALRVGGGYGVTELAQFYRQK